VLLAPAVRVFHSGARNYDGLEKADRLLAHAAFLSKYSGFFAGLVARLTAILGALFGFRFGELRYMLAGQKIDGTQS
jgi:hypothetical protein